jgi:hypothetical protein
LSFSSCLRLLRLRLPECPPGRVGDYRQWSARLLAEMAQERLPPRGNRVNPRVAKREMSELAKKRPCHRPAPPLKKEFVDTIVPET